MMHLARVMVGAVVVAGLGGCIHVAGVVTRMDGRPLSTAVFSIGRPTDIANYGTHHVDAGGKFSFYIGPADETNLFLYDGAGEPKATIRQVPAEDVSDHMRLKMTPTIPDMDPAGNTLD